VCVVLCQESVRGPRGLEGGGGLQGTGGGQGMGKYAFNSNFTLLPGRDGGGPWTENGPLGSSMNVSSFGHNSVLGFLPWMSMLCCAVQCCAVLWGLAWIDDRGRLPLEVLR